jgi:hypothetical protein
MEGTEIERVDFRPATNGADRRAARLEMTNGKVFERVYVSSWISDEGRGYFLVHETPESSLADATPIEADIVSLLRFEKPEATPAPEPVPQADDRPTSPTRTPVVPLTPAPEEELYFNPLMPDARYLSPDSEGGAPPPDLIDFQAVANRGKTPRPESGLPDFLTRRFRIPYIALEISLTAFLLYLMLGTAMGAVQLKAFAKKEKIHHYSWPRAVLTAEALAMFSCGAIYVASRFIPGIGLFVGLAAGYVIHRMGLMASLEILEEKAHGLMSLYAALQVGLVILVAAVMNNFV